MHENAQGQPGGAKLASMVLSRLLMIGLIFIALNTCIVIATYALDEQSLAEDLVKIEIAKVTRAFSQSHEQLQLVTIARWSDAFALQIFDSHGASVFEKHLNALTIDGPTGVRAPDVETTYRKLGRNFIASGYRRVVISGATYSILLSIHGSGVAPLLSSLGHELVAHVAVPLVPLFLLFFALASIILRRTLGPLDAAVEAVNRLDSAQISTRIAMPVAPQEIRALLAAVNRALDRMAAAVRRLRQFTADAAHELRTPLAVMTLGLEQLPASEAQRNLRRDMAGMSRLVNQMVDLERSDTLEISADARTDLRSLATSVVTRLLPLALRDRRSIRYTALSNARVVGQQDILERALRNIIENALIYTPEGSAVEVVVGPGPQIVVTDDGPGIAPAIREKVFERFWRAHTGDGRGSGLGLAIAREILTAHRGRIEISEGVSGGARVSLVFESA